MGRPWHGWLARGLGWGVAALTVVLFADARASADDGGASPPAERSGPGHEVRSWIGGMQVERSPVISGHGWLALPDAVVGDDGPKALVVHVPPRTAVADQWGMVRPVTTVGGRVAAAAWERERLYLLMEPEGKGAARRVFSLQALRGSSLFYECVPEGRVEVLPNLSAPGELVGMAVTERGPVVMLVEVEAGRRTARLHEFRGSEWKQVDGPWMAGEPQRRLESLDSGHVRLLEGRDGVQIMTEGRDPGTWDLWSSMPRAVTGAGPNDAGRDTISGWGLRIVSRRCADGMMLPAWPEVVQFVRGRGESQDALLVAWWDKAETIVAAVGEGRGSSPRVVAKFAGMPRPPATIVVGMDAPDGEGADTGSLAFVWAASGDTSSTGAAGPNSDSALSVREVLATGKEMYSGPARLGSLVRRVQYQALALLLVLVMVGVLVFVLRGDPQVVPVLPKGVGVADPMRRLAAAVLDFVPSAVLVGIVEGRGALALLTPDTMLSGPGGSSSDADLLPIGLALAVTVVHATLGEWLMGRSLGKALVGIRVVSIEGREGDVAQGGVPRELVLVRPKLWQALVRNVVRWVVSPLAVFAVLDVAGRHPGDLAARTLVVAAVEVGE